MSGPAVTDMAYGHCRPACAGFDQIRGKVDLGGVVSQLGEAEGFRPEGHADDIDAEGDTHAAPFGFRLQRQLPVEFLRPAPIGRRAFGELARRKLAPA